MKKNYKVFGNNQVSHILLFLHANIFMPIKSKLESDDKVFIHSKRTSGEELYYEGPHLDINTDFKIFSFLVKLKKGSSNNLVTFTERQILDFLGIKDNEKKVIEPISKRLQKLTRSSFEICIRSGENEISYGDFFIKDISWCKVQKIISCKVSSVFGEMISENFHTYNINTDDLDKLKGKYCNYAKCLYIYLKSRRFTLINKQELIDRICPHIKSRKNQNFILARSLEILKNNNVIKDFDFVKSRLAKIEQVSIKK